VQTELAHAIRAVTMGQLTASIAHEVKQPIGAPILIKRDFDVISRRTPLRRSQGYTSRRRF
jgi:C4-dicarboxylate-specific signal transduction histidine kinase